MNINNPKFNAPVTFNENHSVPELAQLRQSIEEQSEKNRELSEILNRLADSIEAGNRESMQKNAAEIMKNVGSSTLANVLGGSILALIQSLARG